MNLGKRIYSRTFQKVLKLVQPFLPYREPTVLKSIEQIPGVLELIPERPRPMVVTDRGIIENELLMPLEEVLSKNYYAVYDKVEANPSTENVEEAVELYHRNSCNCLIGMGGGSAIDCAKAVGAKISRPGKSLEEMEGLLKIFKRIPLFVAIPTTAGTGSETTLTTVITDKRSKHKFTINDFELIPHFAVLDPALTTSLPKKLSATTGMDALTHAIEAYIGGALTDETAEMAKEAVKLVLENIENVYENPEDLKAREAMLRASHIAGIAFSKSYVGYVHAVAHSLGGKYDIPHGLANAVLLPIFLEEYDALIYPKLYELAVAAGLVGAEVSVENGAKSLINKLYQLNRTFEIPDAFEELKLKDVPEMARNADHEANPLYPVPKLMDARELEKIYLRVLPKRL